MKEMDRHFLFCDNESGEEFLVGACDREEAKKIASDNFSNPRFICEMTDFEAECSGLDEY
jgi:hypothetical protein